MSSIPAGGEKKEDAINLYPVSRLTTTLLRYWFDAEESSTILGSETLSLSPWKGGRGGTVGRV